MEFYPRPKKVGDLIQNELFNLQKQGREEESLRLPPAEHMGELYRLISYETLSTTVEKRVFYDTCRTGEAPSATVERQDLMHVSDANTFIKVLAEVLTSNPIPVADYRAG